MTGKSRRTWLTTTQKKPATDENDESDELQLTTTDENCLTIYGLASLTN